jgi:hypothetical protein
MADELIDRLAGGLMELREPAGTSFFRRSHAEMALVAAAATRKHSLRGCKNMSGGGEKRFPFNKFPTCGFTPIRCRFLQGNRGESGFWLLTPFTSGSAARRHYPPQRLDLSLRRKNRQTRSRACNWRLMP